ncbi:hypothetical protein [Pedobacter cryoconitis]|uniref:Uncharacterized protein n=1 Tax=Pedobacter cryoconitis TaxID=188932 RepID=A0A7X0J365_9SPHI|nr:hypothetical protein [Pedobacter cryoconitis]MBB6500264.1 hypothetical protein [Pedobacter cryoconitis]
MGEQLTTSAEALRLFFTEDIYLIHSEENILSDAPALPEPAPAAQVKSFKYLGKNQKNILILVNDGQHEVSTEKGRELLRNIVKAIQLTANDFALLNYAAYANTDLETLKNFFSSNVVFAFGVSPLALGIDEQPMNVIISQGKTQLVFSGNLDGLADDQAGKKMLWGSLKKLSI